MSYNRCLFIYLFVISPHELQAQLVNHHETLPRDQYLAEFYNASPKINLGALP